jgi:hypothetical protein
MHQILEFGLRYIIFGGKLKNSNFDLVFRFLG